MNAFAAVLGGKAAELQKELEVLSARTGAGRGATSIPAAFLKVTVAV